MREEIKNESAIAKEGETANISEENKQKTEGVEEVIDQKETKATDDTKGKKEIEIKGGKKSVNELMSVYLLTASPEITLREANRLMSTKKTRHILITDYNKKLLGILSDRDIKKFVSPFAGSNIANSKDRATLDLKIGQIMTKNPITITPEKSIRDCIELMLEKSISALPVINDAKQLVGIITTTNIFKYILSIMK